MITMVLNCFARCRSRVKRTALHIGRRGRHYLWRIRPQQSGEVVIGDDSMVLASIVLERPGAVVRIGHRSFVGAGTIASATRVEIGDDVLVAWGVTISDHDSHAVQFRHRAHDVASWIRGEKEWQHVASEPVTIGPKSWIGFNAIILKGVTVGEGAVVGAGSVVTKDVAPWTVVAGNPARLIREISIDER